MVGEPRSPAEARGTGGAGVGLLPGMETGVLDEGVLAIEGSRTVRLRAGNLFRSAAVTITTAEMGARDGFP